MKLNTETSSHSPSVKSLSVDLLKAHRLQHGIRTPSKGKARGGKNVRANLARRLKVKFTAADVKNQSVKARVRRQGLTFP